MSDFTDAIVGVFLDRRVMEKYPDGIAPVDILSEVWKKYPGQFRLCTVIDVTHEKDAVMERLHL